MPEISKSTPRRARKAAEEVDDARAGAQETAGEATGEVTATAEDTGQEAREQAAPKGGGGDGGPSLTSELRETVREAAIEVLKPVLRTATKTAAKYAVTQGPQLVKDRVAPKLESAGGAGAIMKDVASRGGGVAEKVGGVASGIGGMAGKLGGGGKKEEGKSPSGTGRGRRLPVQEFVDVGVDLETAYDQFTQFEDWPKFMHRVESIEQRDDATLMWQENIWGVRRSWEADITDQTPCERIAWRSKNGPQTVGVVTFHRLSDRLTRIYVTMDFQPQGLFEKAASGTRISRRALKSDLMRFKAFVEMRDEPTGAWRGEIEEGEVVEGEGQEEQPQAEEQGEEPEAEEEGEEPEASEDEDYADEDEEPEEEEQRPRRGRSGRFERTASSDEEDEQEEEPEPPRRASTRRRRAPASDRGGR